LSTPQHHPLVGASPGPSLPSTTVIAVDYQRQQVERENKSREIRDRLAGTPAAIITHAWFQLLEIQSSRIPRGRSIAGVYTCFSLTAVVTRRSYSTNRERLPAVVTIDNRARKRQEGRADENRDLGSWPTLAARLILLLSTSLSKRTSCHQANIMARNNT
jgi:hypothetical protein